MKSDEIKKHGITVFMLRPNDVKFAGDNEECSLEVDVL